jgi:hypothetical protein
MRCPNCRFENEANKKFCTKCGTRLSPKCPGCESEVGTEDLFCGECGHNLTTPGTSPPKDRPLEDKLDQLQRYLPHRLTEKILAIVPVK